MKKYVFKVIKDHVIMLKKPKMRRGVLVEYETRQTFMYYGVIGPYVRDYVIMSTADKREAIWHTEKELNRVSELLERKGIKDFCIFEMVDRKIEQPINIALYEK